MLSWLFGKKRPETIEEQRARLKREIAEKGQQIQSIVASVGPRGTGHEEATRELADQAESERSSLRAERAELQAALNALDNRVAASIE